MTPETMRALNDPARLAPYVGPKVQATNRDRTSGMLVPYIDARAAEAILDACAPGWQTKVTAGPEPVVQGSGTLGYATRVALTIDGVTREDVGFNAVTGDGGQAHDTALKGSVSDGLKRASVQFGIGRALYDLPAPWVALNDRGYPASDQEVASVVANWRSILTSGQAAAPPAAQPAQAPPPPPPAGPAYPPASAPEPPSQAVAPTAGAPAYPPAAQPANGQDGRSRATPGREPTEAQERAVGAIIRRLNDGAPDINWQQFADDFIHGLGGRDRSTVSRLIDQLGQEQQSRGIAR